MQRTLKFTRYLPRHGWKPTVVTGPAGYWIRDPSLLEEIGPETEVVRAPHWGARFIGGAGSGGARSRSRLRSLRALARFFLVPDAYVGWTIPAGRIASRLLEQTRFDALLTTSSPDSAHLLGRRLRRTSGVPWVADFRDPWTRRMAYAPPTPVHDRLHRALERGCLRDADRIVTTSEETREDFLRRTPGLDAAKVRVIPNGYDEEDFRAAEARLRGPRSPEPEVAPAVPVLHAGHLNPERPITPYLEGLRRFLEHHPGRSEEARTLFLGAHYDRDLEEVRRLGLERHVEFAANRTHLDAVTALLQARVLLLLEQNSDRGRLILPGKVFEYLRAGPPILALVPPGGAADRLVRSLDAGLSVDPARPEAVAEALVRLLDAPSGRRPSGSESEPPPRTGGPGESGPLPGDGSESPLPGDRSQDPLSIHRFERVRLTERLAALLDEVALFQGSAP